MANSNEKSKIISSIKSAASVKLCPSRTPVYRIKKNPIYMEELMIISFVWSNKYGKDS